jgi:NADH-quinone oxidoreductase E subunit
MKMKMVTHQPVDLGALYEILQGVKGTRDASIPILQQVQETYGYIPAKAIPLIAQSLGLFPTEIQGVVSFYTQFSLTPKGRNIVRVCRGTACHVRGGKGVLRVVKRVLDIDEGQTTEDLTFTLETVACLGACALAPVMVVNKTYYGQMNPKRIETLLHALRGSDVA